MVSDGYGSGWTIEYDKNGKFIQDFGGRLKDRKAFTAGKFTTAHGVDVFNAGAYDVVTVADREKQRVQHFVRDRDGEFQYVSMSAKTGSIGLNELEGGLEPIGGLDQTDQMGNACNIRYSPDQKFAVVPELTSRVTVYNVGPDGGLTDVVAHLGDGRPHRPNRGKADNTWPGYFATPHYAGFHGNPGDIVVSQYTNAGAGSVLLRKLADKKA